MTTPGKLVPIALTTSCSMLPAQWPSFPTAGASKTPDGGLAMTPPTPGPRPFQNLCSLFPDGLPLQPWAAELRSQRLAENSKDHPDAHCLPLHPVRLHFHPQPRKIIETPGLVLILCEANGSLRQIFTDGRFALAIPIPGGSATRLESGRATR